MGKTKNIRRTFAVLLAVLVLILGLLWLFSAVNGLHRDSSYEGCRQLELALRRAAVACYAAEGIYPPTLDYLTEHFGIQIQDKYIVHYEIFASNLMPEITVLEKGAQ